MKRMANVIYLNEADKAEYIKMHEEMVAEHRDIIAKANIRNFSIFLREPENLLFSYMEYHGTDFEADMAKLKEYPRIQRWRAITDNMQTRLPSAEKCEHWAPMQEVFHTNQ